MRRPWTLRARLVVALVVLAAVGLTAVGAASVWLLQRSLIARVDEQLMGVGREWLRPAAIHSRQGTFGGVRPGPGGPRVPTDFRIVLLDNQGRQVGSFGRPADEGAPALPLLDRPAVLERAGLPFTVPDTDGDGRWRVRALAGDGSRATAGPNRTAVVAMSLDTVDTTVDRLLVIELVVGVLVLAGLGGLTWWVVRVGIRPLTRIERTAEAIAGGDLDRRVEGADPRTETGRVATALNTMVGRLGAALRQRTESEGRLRRFVGDASHELRTPLTSIRGFAELYRKGGARSKEDVDRMMGQIETEAVRMGRLVDDLLLLARLDSERPLDLTEVDLGALAAEAVHDVRLVEAGAQGGEAGAHEVALSAAAGVHLLGDAGRLRQVVTNLLTNAVRHTPPGTAIRVTVSLAPAGDGRPASRAGRAPAPGTPVAVLEVADAGPGIPLDQAPYVFDRFYRADPSRARKGGGTGLGLAITAAIVEAHQGCVELHTAPGKGARFRVMLPLGANMSAWQR